MTTKTPGEAVPSDEVLLATSRAFMAAANRSSTLYELSEDFLRLLDIIEAQGTDDELEAQLDQIAGLITHKAEAIGGLTKHLEGMAAMRMAEADRLRERARTDVAHADRLRSYLLRHMQAIGSSRIETSRFTFSVRTNPPAVEVLDEDLVPDEFIRSVTTTSVDKRAILEHVKADGEIPPGVDLVRRQRLDIR